MLFDLRWIITLLFGCYGAVLSLLGAFATSAADRAKAGGVNVNLWAGLAMLVFAALMGGWALWRPLERPAQREDRS
ncbi:hypothetical protein [Kitasatospora viridis]|uniref:Uncharacterized protein n=1 Tax=Kitasatospora viridis TaxID=281105 RepID=A0A561UNA4_9ACTN|nr:hypothetical protein [Kitasatospora viridis]TWG00840.1 hypothetical protein FHX73_114720 [Kitasatospora viridis]